MTDKTYNGWTNYATWRVNLEMFDGMSPGELLNDAPCTVSTLADTLKEYAENWLDDAQGLAYEWAMAFIADVNWQEIAQHMLDAYPESLNS